MTPVPTATVVRLVAGREVRDRLRNRGYVVGILATTLLLMAAIAGPRLLGDDGPPRRELAVTSAVDPMVVEAVRALADTGDARLELQGVDDRDAALARVDAGDVDAALVMGDRGLQVVLDGSDDLVVGWVTTAAEQVRRQQLLARASVPPELAQQLLETGPPPEVVDPSGSGEDFDSGETVAFLATILLFLTIQINAGTLLTGTIEEKSSRVVEVLLGTIRPWQLLSGKLIGLSMLAFGQLGIYVVGMLLANRVGGATALPEAAAPTIGAGLLMFVVGFGFYAALYAVAGSLASSVEDAQASAGPLGFVVVGTYLTVLVGVIPNPTGLLARILTFVPPTAPFTVPARVSTGSIAVWEVVAATLVTLAGTALTVRLAGRLYSAALLSGSRLRWREVFRLDPIR